MMSLDKDTVVTHDGPLRLSPSFTAGGLPLPQQPQLTKVHPLYPKFGLQQPNNGQPLPSSSPPPTQRIGKRRYTVGVGFKGLAKRRRRAHSESQADPVLPSHFLLGGNIFDPLNLNSLLNEEVSRATNQETPKCSPLPSRCRDPVEILVPRDITDPLNLKGGSGDGEEEGGVLLSPLKSRRRHRNRHHGGGGGEGEKEAIPARLFNSSVPFPVPLLTREGSAAASPLPCELNTAITCRDDVAPPPVLPRRHTHPPPGHVHKSVSHGENRQRRRRRTTSSRLTDAGVADVPSAPVAQTTKFQTPLMGGEKAGRCVGSGSSNQPPLKKKKNKLRYQYGNHSHYYGYHGFYGDNGEGRVGSEQDGRLRLLRSDWFRDKTVLDVGCGVGHVALAIARKFNPVHVIGVELDKQLVHAAKQNIRHFLSHDLVVNERSRRRVENRDEEKKEEEEVIEELYGALSRLSFPMSFRVTRGPLSAPPLTAVASSSGPPSSSRFPNNITFIQGDYVSKQEMWPGQGQYDVVLCLNVTKWVHLQSGDAGVVTLFRRVYHSLPLGGLFILEPEPWSSYSRSKRTSEVTRRHYRSLKLKPEQFTSFLTDTVGFSSYRLLTHSGNRRPIYMFHKGPAQRK